MSENEPFKFQRWSNLVSLALVVFAGPRSILPAGHANDSATWWEPSAWLRANRVLPKSLRSRTVYRSSYSPRESDEILLVRSLDWDGAADRVRVERDDIGTLSLQLRYAAIEVAEWARFRASIGALQRAIRGVETAVRRPESDPIDVFKTTDARRVVSDGVFREFHCASENGFVTFGLSPTGDRSAYDDDWDSVWEALTTAGLPMETRGFVERFEIAPFGAHIDVPAEELHRVEAFSVSPEW